MPARRFVAAGLVLGFSACNRPAPTASSAAPAAPISEITLSDYAIAAPTTMPAGYVTFRTRNSGKEDHQAGLIRLDSNKTIDDFRAAVAKSGPPPAWITLMGGPQNSSEVTIDLTPGNYVWYCMIPGPDGVPHVAKGMLAAMTVTPASGPTAVPPVADIDVTMHDYQWDLSKPLTAGHHVLKVETAAGQPHEMVLVHLEDGKTPADVLGWLQKPDGPPPFLTLDGITAMQAGETNYAAVDIVPGQYALFCFLDAPDGKPHVAHGMVQPFTVQ
ncbi:MAG TPA: hypothetical protein VGM77_01000 [Gemmatimonadales bacterium]|jgi:hypothetical protein